MNEQENSKPQKSSPAIRFLKIAAHAVAYIACSFVIFLLCLAGIRIVTHQYPVSIPVWFAALLVSMIIPAFFFRRQKQFSDFSIPDGYTPNSYADALIQRANQLANDVNYAKTVLRFSVILEELFSAADILIWLNETKHVHMNTPPRLQKERMESNMEVIICDFIDRAFRAISTASCATAEQVDFLLAEIDNCDMIQHYMTQTIQSKIHQLHACTVPIQAPQVSQPEVPKIDVEKIGVKEHLDCSGMDAMIVIQALERNIERIYQCYCSNEQLRQKGPEIFAKIQAACASSNFPLAAEIRLESLLASYAPKFAQQNPLEVIDKMGGLEFEQWCADLLRHNGYEKVSVTPSSGDQGVDVLAEKEGVKYAVQCKCYASDLGNTPVQEVYAGKSFYGCHVGVVMTNRHFTSGAKQLAEATGVMLWDREKIQEFLNSAAKAQ